MIVAAAAAAAAAAAVAAATEGAVFRNVTPLKIVIQ